MSSDAELQSSRPQREADTTVAASAQARNAAISGQLAWSRGGWVRVVLLISGLALLGWLVRALLWMLGYRHPAALYLHPESVEVRGERRFLGLPLGGTRLLIPLSAVRRVSLVARSPWWALVAGLGVLAAAGVVATTLIIWGVSGSEPSWVLLGLGIIALGVLCDGVAYLLVRRASKRALATLRVCATRRRFALARVSAKAADELLDQLARMEQGQWAG